MNSTLISKLDISAESLRPIPGGGFILAGPSVTLELPFRPKRYLRHGWQSWTLTAWIDTSRRLPPMRPPILRPMHTDPVYSRLRNHNGSWYSGVETLEEEMLLLGALGLEAHVELNGDQMKGTYETGTGEWFVSVGNESEVLARYAELLGARYGRGRIANPPRVWCSWYSLYTEINETQLLKILNDLGDLPFEVFQIDDGWQAGIGDWEANEKFPSGMDSLAAKIKATGRTAGLWLAPLLVVPSSTLYRQHPDWLLHDEMGQLVPAGINWGEQLYALDTTHPDALAWLSSLMKKVRGWGYDYLKLDFLYAGALPGKRYVSTPRETAYRNGLQVIRESAGQAYLLTCGAPVFPSLGLCDGLRVGPDVSEEWESRLFSQLLEDYANSGSRSALRTALNRLWLQPLVNTDPDVVFFRTARNKLTPEQKALLQDLALIAGFKATSDLPAWLTGEELAALRNYLAANPEIEQIGRTVFKIDGRMVDFTASSQMPPPPGPITSVLGRIVGWLGNYTLFIRAFEKINRTALQKALEKETGLKD